MTAITTPEEIDESFAPQPSTDVAWAYVDGEAVLLRQGTADVHHLNGTSALVWQCLDGASTLGELIDDISDVYEVDRAAVAADVLTVVRQFGSLDLLTGVVTAASGRGKSNGGHKADPEPRAEPRYIAVPPSR